MLGHTRIVRRDPKLREILVDRRISTLDSTMNQSEQSWANYIDLCPLCCHDPAGCRTGRTQGRIANSAPPLILCRFWFYTTPLVDLWPLGVNPALTLSDLGSVCVEEVTFYLVFFWPLACSKTGANSVTWGNRGPPAPSRVPCVPSMPTLRVPTIVPAQPLGDLGLHLL